MRSRAPAVRRDAGLYGYERALARRGFWPVAGADETGRGACAGPMVVAAVLLPGGARGRVPGLADSKLLTPTAREDVYAEVLDRAIDWSVVSIPPAELDRHGLHACNLAGMRRALARLWPPPAYVLTDGFPVRGVGAPGLAMRRGDRVAACVAAASVVAKVRRDRAMTELHERYPDYGFAVHKGYVTASHNAALTVCGPCPEHRFSFVNVARSGSEHGHDAAGAASESSFPPRAGIVETRVLCGSAPSEEGNEYERRGLGEVRNRDGAAALPGVP